MLPVCVDLSGFGFMDDYQSSSISPNIWKMKESKKFNWKNRFYYSTILSIEFSQHSKYQFPLINQKRDIQKCLKIIMKNLEVSLIKT
jgi:hypothetical protein